MKCIQEAFKSVTNLLLQFIFAVVDGDAVIMPIETVYESLKKKRRENFKKIRQKGFVTVGLPLEDTLKRKGGEEKNQLEWRVSADGQYWTWSGGALDRGPPCSGWSIETRQSRLCPWQTGWDRPPRRPRDPRALRNFAAYWYPLLKKN